MKLVSGWSELLRFWSRERDFVQNLVAIVNKRQLGSLAAATDGMIMAASPNMTKRSLSEAEATQSAKRLKKPYQHHHALQYPTLSIPSSVPAFVDGVTVDDLLERSIALVFEHIGVRASDAVTLESFRHDVEECTQPLSRILHLLLTTD